MLDHLLFKKLDFEGLYVRCRADVFGRHLIALLRYLQFLMIWAMWYNCDWVHTYEINMGGKFKYLSKPVQHTVHFIISLDDLLGN